MKPAIFALCAAVALLAGCGSVPKIKVPKLGTVIGVQDQGKPAELSETKVETTVDLPKGSTVTTEPATGRMTATVAEATVMTQVTDIVAATTGSVDVEVAQHRITEEKKTKVAQTRVYIGVGLILVGLVVGFALPPGLRWPTIGIKVAVLGALFVFIPDPPAWMIAALIAAALAMVYTFYIKNHAEKNG
jgi:uncharacterized protein YceK